MKSNLNFHNSISGKKLACFWIFRQISHAVLSQYTKATHRDKLIPSSNAEAPEFQKQQTGKER